MGLEQDKLQCLNISSRYSIVLHSIPLKEYLERVILGEEDDILISPEDDIRLKNNVRIFLGKDVAPPMIYVHIDDDFAAQYSYFSEKFAEKSDVDLY